MRRHRQEKDSDCRFIDDLKKNTLKSRKTLVFFIIFASFCFSAMTQMSASMKDLSSVMMGIMIMLIGLVLASTTLFLAITTVIQGNTKTIAMMRVFGYSQKDCCGALLGGYRPLAYIGFAVGTIYQYALLRIMVDIVFKDVEGVPVYKFDFPAMLISLAAFAVIYEIIMYVYSEKIKKISIKEIMLE
jgi:predicted lysophospholipase L1 biosynthesis ABC-type transport system permease subunit